MKIGRFLKLSRYFIEYIFVFFFCSLVRALPLRATRIMAWIAGTFMYFIPSFRKLAFANIKIAFPEKTDAECMLICRRSLKNTILIFLEFSWFVGSKERIDKYVTINQEHDRKVNEIFERKKGLLYCTGHFGNWDVEGIAIPLKWPHVPFAVIAKTSPNPFFSKLLESARTSTNTLVIPSKGAVKGMMKAMHDAYFFATLIDQNTRVRDGGIFVNFFGLPVPTSRAPAMFARKMGIPLAMTFCIRKENSFEMIYSELEKNASEYENDTELMQALMNEMEKIIRKYPEQYVWMYKRFQTIPKEASPELIARYPYYSELAKDKFYSKK